VATIPAARRFDLSDEQWAVLAPLLPSVVARGVVCSGGAISYRCRAGKGSQVQILSSRHSSEAISITTRWPL